MVIICWRINAAKNNNYGEHPVLADAVEKLCFQGNPKNLRRSDELYIRADGEAVVMQKNYHMKHPIYFGDKTI